MLSFFKAWLDLSTDLMAQHCLLLTFHFPQGKKKFFLWEHKGSSSELWAQTLSRNFRNKTTLCEIHVLKCEAFFFIYYFFIGPKEFFPNLSEY